MRIGSRRPRVLAAHSFSAWKAPDFRRHAMALVTEVTEGLRMMAGAVESISAVRDGEDYVATEHGGCVQRLADDLEG